MVSVRYQLYDTIGLAVHRNSLRRGPVALCRNDDSLIADPAPRL